MVVDGFKSYGTRTEINGFDPMFNAITGLNGSGWDSSPPLLSNFSKAVVCFWLREMHILINIVDQYRYFLGLVGSGSEPKIIFSVSFALRIQLFNLLSYLIFSG
jgi:hypothetical protein